MNTTMIGIVDYGAGNHRSVTSAVHSLGYRTRMIRSAEDISGIDLLLLPGVGAFVTAMSEIRALGLDQVLRQWAYEGKPLLGICLGMQMLADVSYEHGTTRGLELIPGKVQPLTTPDWHIGWNRLEITEQGQSFLKPCYGQDFYFNHSFEFNTSDTYVIATSRLSRPLVAAVKRDNVCGLQFHPEKSQAAGKNILKITIDELLYA
ncbi:imidazole glycerol phosphate synthase subunit HisH [Bacterioplanoides sp.]|uniref:imidazole glycerol phosphate synthase subunit HisH n=1 Tax=Bacterioplanoides sp. TaxID=2066072 RepID=UPI003B00574A